MSAILNMTINNSYDMFANQKVSSGTVVTEEMKSGQHKTTTEMVDINAYDYGIIDVGMTQFDDTLNYTDKVKQAQIRIEL